MGLNHQDEEFLRNNNHNDDYDNNNNNNNNNKVEIIIDDEDDGFKTPTSLETKIKVNYSCPPPAPMKPKSKPMKRRRLGNNKPMLRFLQVSHEDFGLLFHPRSLLLCKDNNNFSGSFDNNSNSNSNSSSNNNHNNVSSSSDTKISHKANNFTTLMSFR
ncbi:hypothetical protein RND81_04G165800 [Saponaria officinalis]|uniref:Uncharacterized protein n=1 Tax=Saponaria officinalis TaxID=3572 RepID=A0AAW1LID3_SAPOF